MGLDLHKQETLYNYDIPNIIKINYYLFFRVKNETVWNIFFKCKTGRKLPPKVEELIKTHVESGLLNPNQEGFNIDIS